MIENDLPQGVLKEENYKKVKSKLKTAAFVVWGLSIVIAGIIVVPNLINNNNIKKDIDNSQKAEVDQEDKAAQKAKAAQEAKEAQANQAIEKNLAFKQELADIETKIDNEKKAIFPTYKTTSSYSFTKVGIDEYHRINNALDAVDLKYVDDVQAIADKASVDRSVTGDFLDNDIISIKSQIDMKNNSIKSEVDSENNSIDIDNEKATFDKEWEIKRNEFNMFPAIGVLVMGGMLGLVLMILAHQREVAAYGMQGQLPVMSEGMGKMVKAMDDNGTLDILAETGAKMMGKSADAQIKHNVPEKMANLEKTKVEAQNKAGATEVSAKQQGKYAEEIGKGLKKGLFKK